MCWPQRELRHTQEKHQGPGGLEAERRVGWQGLGCALPQQLGDLCNHTAVEGHDSVQREIVQRGEVHHRLSFPTHPFSARRVSSPTWTQATSHWSHTALLVVTWRGPTWECLQSVLTVGPQAVFQPRDSESSGGSTVTARRTAVPGTVLCQLPSVPLCDRVPSPTKNSQQSRSAARTSRIHRHIGS